MLGPRSLERPHDLEMCFRLDHAHSSTKGICRMVAISTLIWRPCATSLASFDVSKSRELEIPRPAPCVRATFPCQRVLVPFFFTQVCPVEDRHIRIAAATATSRARGLYVLPKAGPQSLANAATAGAQQPPGHELQALHF